MKEFDILEIPKHIKIEYFLTSNFHNVILKYLLAINEEEICDNFKPGRGFKQSSIEKFLLYVSVEFEKYYETNNSKDIGNLEFAETPQIEEEPIQVLNNFLTKIDIDILSAWKGKKDKIDEFDNNKYKNKDERLNLFNDSKKSKMYHKKHSEQDLYIRNNKISSEIFELTISDLVDLIDQLYLYFSVILCIGFFGKRSSWGITQMNYLNKEDKQILKLWFQKEIKFKGFNLDDNISCTNLNNSTEIEDYSVKLEGCNIKSIMKNLGWMNVRDNYNLENIEKNNKLIKKCEEYIIRNEIIENQNIQLIVENEELKQRIKKVNKIIEIYDELREKFIVNKKGDIIEINNSIKFKSNGIKYYIDIQEELLNKTFQNICLKEDIEEYQKQIEWDDKEFLILNDRIKEIIEDKNLTIEKLTIEVLYYKNKNYINNNRDIWEVKKGDFLENEDNIDIVQMNEKLIEEGNKYQLYMKQVLKVLNKYKENFEIMNNLFSRIIISNENEDLNKSKNNDGLYDQREFQRLKEIEINRNMRIIENCMKMLDRENRINRDQIVSLGYSSNDENEDEEDEEDILSQETRIIKE